MLASKVCFHLVLFLFELVDFNYLAEYDETKMVTCLDCEDYDLCVTCLINDAHGHHPGHGFSLIHDRQFTLKSMVVSRCHPGRNQQHAAVCDGCDKVSLPHSFPMKESSRTSSLNTRLT